MKRLTTSISKWGNSSAIRIPASIIKQLNLQENDRMEISINNNEIVLKPIVKEPKNIHELFDGWEDDGIRETELDWGSSKGDELDW
ncbi:AbrB/MazE/SpoVT family DNA-binding domain-containing protein [Companilactobacillus mishanensis]|uniref:AbrB/MazE/SpoVT family DNA-binding domain-containing protein n=1 Tax=Companilactobacillus mishanensis TaxID=2486008 RepID=A0ABW9P7K6_9LACO|nr:AbrB/MazE/SpoVT family DNA-binding domain-containing protein [Companilactobacillus mishanensis]MQS45191.1 AbrB/MazE/SpoVT family DNA-binding domain-containing protein [Companilactobacillus mishanensis]